MKEASKLKRNVSHLSDTEVINLVLNEDKDYFEEIVNRYKNLVFSVVTRMVANREDIYDLSQEIFIKMYKNLDKYSTEYKFSTWCMRISTNHIIDFRRKKKIQQVALTENCYNIEDHRTPLLEVISQEKILKIHKELESLPAIYSEVLILYHLKGFSYQEIADEIEEPLSKVKNRISRGRKLLRQNIEMSKEREVYEL